MIGNKNLETRNERVRKAVRLETPDRVPFVPTLGNVYCLQYGVTIKSAMQDNANLIPALDALLRECDPDLLYTPDFFPLRTMETLGAVNMSWPGKKPEFGDNFTYQINDATYLDDEDYEEFLKDPSAFLAGKVLTQKFSALKGLKYLDFYSLCGSTVMGFAGLGNPLLRESLEKLLEAGRITSEFTKGMMQVESYCLEKGYPVWGNAVMQNPFDSFADNIRGLINTVMDLKTDPDLLSEAVNRMADAVIPKDVAAAKMMHAQYAFIPLHTGVDEFMSPDDYNRYYWPPLRRLIDSLLKEDITPMIFCEGNYYTRLETLKDVPKGQVVYFFEKQDMKKAKEILGDTACIAGNLDTGLLMHGTPEAVTEETKRLLDICAPGGGYIMSNSISLDNCKRENLIAWRQTVSDCGKY